MTLAKRLADLYITGKEVHIDDGVNKPVVVYVRKLNSVDHDKAIKRANAARSRVLAVRGTPESDAYDDLMGTARLLSREEVVDFLLQEHRQDRLPVIEAEMAAEDEWAKDEYLTGLRDAWEGGLNDTYAKAPEDEEAKRVFGEMQRFNKAVAGILDDAVASFEADLDQRSDEDLRREIFDKTLETQGNIAWVQEFRRCEVWLGVREPDKKTRVFVEREEIDELSEEVFATLLRAYSEIGVEPQEGKESPVKEDSSPSSDSPGNPEMDGSSGQATAAA